MACIDQQDQAEYRDTGNDRRPNDQDYVNNLDTGQTGQRGRGRGQEKGFKNKGQNAGFKNRSQEGGKSFAGSMDGSQPYPSDMSQLVNSRKPSEPQGLTWQQQQLVSGLTSVPENSKKQTNHTNRGHKQPISSQSDQYYDDINSRNSLDNIGGAATNDIAEKGPRKFNGRRNKKDSQKSDGDFDARPSFNSARDTDGRTKDARYGSERDFDRKPRNKEYEKYVKADGKHGGNGRQREYDGRDRDMEYNLRHYDRQPKQSNDIDLGLHRNDGRGNGSAYRGSQKDNNGAGRLAQHNVQRSFDDRSNDPGHRSQKNFDGGFREEHDYDSRQHSSENYRGSRRGRHGIENDFGRRATAEYTDYDQMDLGGKASNQYYESGKLSIDGTHIDQNQKGQNRSRKQIGNQYSVGSARNNIESQDRHNTEESYQQKSENGSRTSQRAENTKDFRASQRREQQMKEDYSGGNASKSRYRDDYSDETGTGKSSVNGSASASAFKKTRNGRNHIQDETQRGSLIEQLTNSSYECMVCCGVVSRETAVWNCSSCYHLYHLYCIKKWANSPAALVTDTVTGWRCPACQNVSLQAPTQYTCFCGKLRDPVFSQYITPHSCGEMCGKERLKDCSHPCNILCHPGPCPPCQAFVTRSCLCGKTSHSTKCSDSAMHKCAGTCNKTLNCGRHSCDVGCHAGGCEPCREVIEQVCFCGKLKRDVVCGSSEAFVNSFSCERLCGRRLECGEHDCTSTCHPGLCETCALLPSVVTHCSCGRTLLEDIEGALPRVSCTDPIATCDEVCDKLLGCGNIDNPHRCTQKCHHGSCQACSGVMKVDCRCGAISTQMTCQEALSFKGPSVVGGGAGGPSGNGGGASGDSTGVDQTEMPVYRCTRRCNKKMSCGRHKCPQLCCTSTEHICEVICGHKLSCGTHKCEETCHRGNCSTCWQVSFDELRCTCGAEVIFPPVPCGTKPPDCQRTCSRQHACQHKVSHTCHSEASCPPCTVLISKRCMGDHELRSNIPCYLTDISCGRPCGRPVVCRQHKCITICHKGECFGEGDSCTQPCPLLRPECGHPCLAPCHVGTPCPATQCKAEMTLRCDCGRREDKTFCMQMSEGRGGNEYNKMAAQLVATKLWETQSIDVAVLTKDFGSKKTKKLQCNAECAQFERNQRLAAALDIKSPELSGKLVNATYPAFLKDYAKLNAAFVSRIEETLSQLVSSAQTPKGPKRSHAFKAMPAVQRRVIQELAEFYGCTTETHDEEPNKNVVATAFKDKCYHPNVTLTALVQRELFPKAPVPIPINSKEEDIRFAALAARQSTHVYSSAPSLKLTTSKSAGMQALSKTSKPKHKEPEIDYFDMTE